MCSAGNLVMGFVPVLVMLDLHDVASGGTASIVVGSVVAGTVVVEYVVVGLPHIAIYSALPLGVYCILRFWNCTHLYDEDVCICGKGATAITFVASPLEFDKLGIETWDVLMTVVLCKVSTN